MIGWWLMKNKLVFWLIHFIQRNIKGRTIIMAKKEKAAGTPIVNSKLVPIKELVIKISLFGSEPNVHVNYY